MSAAIVITDAQIDSAWSRELRMGGHMTYTGARRFARAVLALAAGGAGAPQATPWIECTEEMPAVDGVAVFIGQNSAGYVGAFNGLYDENGAPGCMYETAEGTDIIMSDLVRWFALATPAPASTTAQADNALPAGHGLAKGQCLHGVSMADHCGLCEAKTAARGDAQKQGGGA